MYKKAVKVRFFLTEEDTLVIKTFLKKKHYKRSWLEEYLMVSASYLSSILCGSSGFDDDIAQKLSKLGVVNYDS